ncbi:hypothetical protein [Arthrobacter sp. M2012083]|uniref:hypothetical protein n=1 Tax=Arthrobacter sp. M2012083 TaxID=1197706 RepID=UPI0002D41DA2|nr:hypothetical protein [Arthrobacter sp. M2012083]
MNAAGRLGAYAAGLAVIFTGAFAGAAALVPEQAVAAWTHSEASMDGHAGAGHAEQPAPDASTTAGSPVQGVTSERGGYLLGNITAPTAVGTDGELAFTITGKDASPVTGFEASHEKRAHLIVVRSDGTQYRHVHPVMDDAGRWSLPWRWEAAGTYRIYADVVPTGSDANVTLTRTVDVAGSLEPAAPEVSSSDEVQGFQVSLQGDLQAGSPSDLTVSVNRSGQPVTNLQPYLGAYGHLVALRAGDMAYLHTHPEGAGPGQGGVSGPEVKFATTPPTPGRYYLYFDFQVDGKVHTAQFTVDTTGSPRAATAPTPDQAPTDAGTADDGHGGH